VTDFRDAPATHNTINKWAHGISDTYALGLLAEAPGRGVPIVVLPYVNTALAQREAFRTSVAVLRREGVSLLLGDGGFKPHPPRTGSGTLDKFPWHIALDEATHMLGQAT
jgi:hypothetical protein